MQRLVGINLPVFSEKKCLNQRGQKKPCYLCRDHCPAGAVTSKGRKIIVDESLCDGCGICRTVCPSRAFVFDKLNYREALVRMQGQSPCLLTCRESSIEASTMVVPCLGGLPWEFIAVLGLQRDGSPISLNISNCWRCFRQKSLWVLYGNVKKARVFVEKYLELSGGPEMGKLLEFYKCYRANVRAKVAALGYLQEPTEEGKKNIGKYLLLAEKYAMGL